MKASIIKNVDTLKKGRLFSIGFGEADPLYGRTRCIELKPALGVGFGNTGTAPQKRRKIAINKRRVINSRQIRRVLKTRKNRIGNLASRNAFLTVARGNIARPVTDILAVRATLRA